MNRYGPWFVYCIPPGKLMRVEYGNKSCVGQSGVDEIREMTL